MNSNELEQDASFVGKNLVLNEGDDCSSQIASILHTLRLSTPRHFELIVNIS